MDVKYKLPADIYNISVIFIMAHNIITFWAIFKASSTSAVIFNHETTSCLKCLFPLEVTFYQVVLWLITWQHSIRVFEIIWAIIRPLLWLLSLKTSRTKKDDKTKTKHQKKKHAQIQSLCMSTQRGLFFFYFESPISSLSYEWPRNQFHAFELCFNSWSTSWGERSERACQSYEQGSTDIAFAEVF